MKDLNWLKVFLRSRGCEDFNVRRGAGGRGGYFVDVETGLGFQSPELQIIKGQIQSQIPNHVTIDKVDSKAHPEYGSLYLTIHSFWVEK